jgi:beta-RFAP synthase
MSIHVRAPCRLHFGMFGFGHADRPQFGGVGVMVNPPSVDVTIAPSERFAARGGFADRIEKFAAAAAQSWQLPALPQCDIDVCSPPDHVGLGVGTQLALAISAGLRRFLELPELPVEELASSVGRGMRSAVGTYGFHRGGLVVDGGKDPTKTLGKLVCRVAIPDEWRFVLVRVGGERGLAGEREADAFGRLPAVPQEVTRQLNRITDEEMLPAIERRDCGAFGDAVYRFGRLAGECFTAVQGGPFANSETAQLVESIRSRGVPGVGQSSWGPTVFAIAASDAEARSLAEWLREIYHALDCDVTIARPNNEGAQLSTS